MVRVCSCKHTRWTGFPWTFTAGCPGWIGRPQSGQTLSGCFASVFIVRLPRSAQVRLSQKTPPTRKMIGSLRRSTVISERPNASTKITPDATALVVERLFLVVGRPAGGVRDKTSRGPTPTA